MSGMLLSDDTIETSTEEGDLIMSLSRCSVIRVKPCGKWEAVSFLVRKINNL